jgi:hypothetical protein
MALNFNKNLFSALGSSNAFQSATTEKATATNSQASVLRTRLDKYLPAEGQVIIDPLAPDATKVTNCQTALDNYGTGANTLNAHVQTRLASLLDDMQVASAVKEVDSYIDDVPSSCSNINTIAGILAGSTDSLLDATTDILDELDAGITAFDGGTMELEDFEDLLDRVTAELGSNITAILGMVNNEVSMVANMYSTFTSMAKSFQAAALLDDPCVRPFLVQLAGPELSQVLVDDFGVDDIENL